MERRGDGTRMADELRQLTFELQDAVRSHDRPRLESLVGQDFALAGSAGLGVLDKQHWIDAALAIDWASFEFLEVEVTAHDHIAAVIHRLRQTATSDAQDISATWLTVDTWWHTDRGWELASRCARRQPHDR